MTTLHLLICLLHGCLAQPPQLNFNPFKNFRPEVKYIDPFAENDRGPAPVHYIAYECAFNDPACLTRHDEAVLAVAVTTMDRLVCSRRSVHPRACLDTYDRIFSLVQGGSK